MGLLSDLFSGGTGKASADAFVSEDLKRIETYLSDLEDDEAGFLASLALLMGRVANADDDISDEERQKMVEVLKSEMNLDAKKAEVVTELALEQTLKLNIENHLVMRRIKELTDREKQKTVLRVLFRVAAEDDISETESDEIRSIATSFGFSDKAFFGIRSEYREHLAILKKK